MLKSIEYRCFFMFLLMAFSTNAAANETDEAYFTGRQLLSDLDELHGLIVDLHPNPHLFFPEELYRQKFKEAVQALENGGTKIDFFTAVSPLVADIKDDHTILFPPSEPKRILPFSIFSLTDLTVVPISPTAVKFFPENGRLIKINDVPWSTVKQDILATISGSEMVYREKRFTEQPQRFLNAHSNWGESVELTFCVPLPVLTNTEESEQPMSAIPCEYDAEMKIKGFVEHLQLPTISSVNNLQWVPQLQTHVIKLESPLLRSQMNMPENAEYMVVTSKHPALSAGDILLQLNDRPFMTSGLNVDNKRSADLLILRNNEELRFLLPLTFPSKNLGFNFLSLNDTVMLLRIEQFQNQETFKAQLDKMFQEMRQNNQDQLIVDLRKSEGGNPALIRTFFSYVSEEKMSPHKAVLLKRSQHLKSEKTLMYFSLPVIFWWREGPDTYRIPSVKRPPFQRDFVFNGDIILLTNESTFSTAVSFAAVLSDYERALVIGGTTGSHASRMGNPFGFQLGETKIEGLVSKRYYVRPSGEESGSGVTPNRYVESENSLDFALEVMALKKLD